MRLSVMPITGCLGKNMVKNQQFTPTCSPDDSPEIPPPHGPAYSLTSNLEFFWDFRFSHLQSPHHETFAPQPQPIEPQPNKMFLLCLFLEIKVVKGKIRSIYIKGVLLTLINWINITNNIPNMVKNTR